MTLMNIINTSLVLAGFLVILAVIYSIVSSQQMAKRRKLMAELHEGIQPGAEVLFSGGLTGTIQRLDGDFVKIELAKGLVIKASRYAITEIIRK